MINQKKNNHLREEIKKEENDPDLEKSLGTLLIKKNKGIDQRRKIRKLQVEPKEIKLKTWELKM